MNPAEGILLKSCDEIDLTMGRQRAQMKVLSDPSLRDFSAKEKKQMVEWWTPIEAERVSIERLIAKSRARREQSFAEFMLDSWAFRACIALFGLGMLCKTIGAGIALFGTPSPLVGWVAAALAVSFFVVRWMSKPTGP